MGRLGGSGQNRGRGAATTGSDLVARQLCQNATGSADEDMALRESDPVQ
jgi:hypothetical protein